MTRIITTTTNHIEGWEVTRYMAPISVNIVVGSNIFSDVSASFSDFFGGRSGTYERKLQEIYKHATERLTKQAKALGANCILGLKIDVGEVSGKGTQMFMVSALGTPVVAVNKNKAVDPEMIDTENKVISGDLVEKTIKINKFLQQYRENPNISVKTETVDLIVESGNPEASDFVFQLVGSDQYDRQTAEQRLNAYFSSIGPDVASQIAFDFLLTNGIAVTHRNIIIKILAEHNLLLYDKVQLLLEDDEIETRKSALQILRFSKDSYTSKDIEYLQKFVHLIPERFPSLASRSEVKSMFSKNPTEVWICSCTNRNKMEQIFCEKCEKDEFGFKSSEVKPSDILQVVETRLQVLQQLMGSSE